MPDREQEMLDFVATKPGISYSRSGINFLRCSQVYSWMAQTVLRRSVHSASQELSCSPFCSPETLLVCAQDVVMLSIIIHAVCHQASIQLCECVSQGKRPVIFEIQWVFLLGQEHRPTLFAARRCAASHVAEHEEIIDGSQEFFWKISSGSR